MTVDVVGKPQFLKKKDEIVGYQNTNTHIVKEFCSDPPPTSVEWLYDGLVHYSIEYVHSIYHNFICIFTNIYPFLSVNYKDKKSEQKELELEVGIEGHINAAPLMPLDPRSPKPTCFRLVLEYLALSQKLNIVYYIYYILELQFSSLTLTFPTLKTTLVNLSACLPAFHSFQH